MTKWLTRLAAVLMLVPVMIACPAIAVAAPHLDLDAFNSRNKVFLSGRYGDVLAQAFKEAGNELTINYALHSEVEQYKKDHPGTFVIDVDGVMHYRQQSVFAPAFILGVEKEAFDPTHDTPVDHDQQIMDQAFVGGVMVWYMSAMTEHPVQDPDNKAIASLLETLAEKFENKRKDVGWVTMSYQVGFNCHNLNYC